MILAAAALISVTIAGSTYFIVRELRKLQWEIYTLAEQVVLIRQWGLR